ncbi:hypothetical protein F7725_001295 [Dissostichus mawsoni]|uniref:Uncharacterized protein n=1 Tax=Dissostichus mawsoni TaxID=36200 RepID=A0A7J5ZHB4_DISMA|nr:hypothetical protein F7725_001295 [Dissostichus mawsoni]
MVEVCGFSKARHSRSLEVLLGAAGRQPPRWPPCPPPGAPGSPFSCPAVPDDLGHDAVEGQLLVEGLDALVPRVVQLPRAVKVQNVPEHFGVSVEEEFLSVLVLSMGGLGIVFLASGSHPTAAARANGSHVATPAAILHQHAPPGESRLLC